MKENNQMKITGKPFLKTKKMYIFSNICIGLFIILIIAVIYLCQDKWHCPLWVKIPLYILGLLITGAGLGDLFQSYDKYKSEYTETLDSRGNSNVK